MPQINLTKILAPWAMISPVRRLVPRQSTSWATTFFIEPIAVSVELRLRQILVEGNREPFGKFSCLLPSRLFHLQSLRPRLKIAVTKNRVPELV